MLLYHYTKLQYGLAAIRDKRLKIARYDALNDPFDIMGLSFSEEDERQQLESIKADLGKTNGIICLSETWKEPLMWGHYADSHRGVCLGFEVKAGHYEKIHYRSDRPTLADYKRESIDQLSTEDLRKIAHSKFNQWKYEREWRRIVSLGDEDIVDGNHYLSFGDGKDMKLKYIFFGMNCKISKAKISQIALYDRDVKFAIAGPASKDFDIIINPEPTKNLIASDRRVLSVPVPKSLDGAYLFELTLESHLANLGPEVRERNRRMQKKFETMNAEIQQQFEKSQEQVERFKEQLEKSRQKYLKAIPTKT